MNILLAGANGIIGSFLYNRFYKEYSITALNYSEENTKDNFYKLDLTQEAEIKTIIDQLPQCDVLVFLVGLAHKKGKRKELYDYRQVNKETLINLLSALENKKKIPRKIIFSSTISIYGERYHQSIYMEDAVQFPISPYAVTKMNAEQYLLEKFVDRTWILRFAPVYSSDFLLNINRRTQIGGQFYRVGKGDKKLSLCNIENIGVAVEEIIKDKIPAGIYNLSDTKEYTYDELLRWKNANWMFLIPVFAIKFLYYFGKVINSAFLIENTIKLISDNSFPSKKICTHINLPSTIYDIQFDHD